MPLTVHRPAGRRAFLVAAPPAAPVADTVWIVCPWLAGLPAAYGLWLSALPIHDANAHLVDALDAPPADPGRTDVYWGVFAMDLFRSRETLWKLARRKGIGGLINLPSVAFFAGQAGSTFATLGFSVASEARFLLEARAAGFRVGFYGMPQSLHGLAFHDVDIIVTAEPPASTA